MQGRKEQSLSCQEQRVQSSECRHPYRVTIQGCLVADLRPRGKVKLELGSPGLLFLSLTYAMLPGIAGKVHFQVFVKWIRTFPWRRTLTVLQVFNYLLHRCALTAEWSSQHAPVVIPLPCLGQLHTDAWWSHVETTVFSTQGGPGFTAWFKPPEVPKPFDLSGANIKHSSSRK